MRRLAYVLSILSALLLPATLLTGFFGMNTGGLPFRDSTAGTVVALALAVLASLGVYALLRRLRRSFPEQPASSPDLRAAEPRSSRRYRP